MNLNLIFEEKGEQADSSQQRCKADTTFRSHAKEEQEEEEGKDP